MCIEKAKKDLIKEENNTKPKNRAVHSVGTDPTHLLQHPENALGHLSALS